MNLYQSLIIISMATGLGVSIELLSTELKITKELLAKYFNQCNKCAQKMPDGFQFQEDGTCGAIELFPHAVCVTSSDNEVVEFHIDVDLEKANHSLKSKMIEEFDDAISFFELLFGVSSRWKKVNQYTQLRENYNAERSGECFSSKRRAIV